MKRLVVLLGVIVLAGCALPMDHPSATLAQQKADRLDCKARSEGGSVRSCMLARGYLPPRLPREE
jgi:hypothetical protein